MANNQKLNAVLDFFRNLWNSITGKNKEGVAEEATEETLVEETVAEEAMAEYLAAYNAYMNYVDSVNNDVTATGNAIGSLRVPCGITNVIAIILKKLFGV
jgi:hypothetical protein